MLTANQKHKFALSGFKTFFLINPLNHDEFLAFTCREALHKSFTSEFKEIFYKPQEFISFENSCGMYLKFEEILNISEKTQFELIEKNLIKVTVSPFWMSCYMRRSLFTKLFRSCFCVDKKDKLDASKFIKQYFQNTHNGLALFLSGYTKYIGTIPSLAVSTQHIPFGWDQAFTGKDINFILSNLLTK